jgi:hypothetical protein
MLPNPQEFSPISLSLFLSLSLSLSLDVGKEVRRQQELVQDDVGVCKGGRHFYSPVVV